jgi:hypothetical protein
MKKIFLGLMAIALLATTDVNAGGGKKKKARKKAKIECKKEQCCDPKSCKKDDKCCDLTACVKDEKCPATIACSGN